jgi:hypothetical protein
VYYKTSTVLTSSPILQTEDTMQLQGEFYKFNNDLYYRNNNDEVYLQDSLMIEINHSQKTILISKVNVETKPNINMLPLDDKKVRELVKTKYTIAQKELQNNTEQLVLEAKEPASLDMVTQYQFVITYQSKTNVPNAMQMSIAMKQQLLEEDMQALPTSTTEEKKLVQLIDGKNWLVRNQQIIVTIADFSTDKTKAGQMPLWTKVLAYDAAKNEFIGKELLADYEITKTF